MSCVHECIHIDFDIACELMPMTKTLQLCVCLCVRAYVCSCIHTSVHLKLLCSKYAYLMTLARPVILSYLIWEGHEHESYGNLSIPLDRAALMHI